MGLIALYTSSFFQLIVSKLKPDREFSNDFDFLAKTKKPDVGPVPYRAAFAPHNVKHLCGTPVRGCFFIFPLDKAFKIC